MTDPIVEFRVRSARRLATVLGALCPPMALVDLWQSVDRSDPFLAAASVVYLVGGLGLALFAVRVGDLRGFVAPSLLLVLGTVLLETPSGSSHFLGLGAFFLVVLGHLADPDRRRAWLVLACVFFPAVLFARELYRPHPLLADPTELVPQALAGGAAVLGLGSVIDQLVATLEAQARLALASARAKDRFLQNMSHELRTPLNAVVGYAELLAEEGISDPEQAGRDLNRIRASARTLLGTIDDILELSRLDEVGARLELELVELSPLFTEVALAVGGLVRPGVALVVPEAPGQVLADAAALRRILVNLVGNAAKFTEAGEIRLVVHRGPSAVVLEVVDTGPGFDPAAAAALFRPFVQGDDSTTRRVGGTGLGLAIAARLAAAMGGSLTAHARPKEGATFRLTLPRT